jgi:hypothetical protein
MAVLIVTTPPSRALDGKVHVTSSGTTTLLFDIVSEHMFECERDI